MGETKHESAAPKKIKRTAKTQRRQAAYVVAAAQGAPGDRDAFTKFLGQQLAPYVGQRVLHLNAGAGGLCQRLLPRETYIACGVDAAQTALLTTQLGSGARVAVAEVRPPFAEHLPRHPQGFDTILWARETSFGELDLLALKHLRTALAPHGRILLLVTGAPAPFVALDSVAERAGLQLRQCRQFDRLGTPVAQAQRLLAKVGLGAPAQALGDAVRPLASRWDDRWPFTGRYALAVLVHPPTLEEAECMTDACQTVRLTPKPRLS